METRGAAGLVIGLPVNMDGTEGPRCQSARAFARHLLRIRDLPVAFWDERLSSAAVNRVLISEADSTRARRAGACGQDGGGLDPAGRVGPAGRPACRVKPMRRDHHPSAFRGALLALAVVALLFRIAAPPGTMVANTGHGAALVICTGHGPMSAMASPGKAPASKTHSDGSCEFAAHAAHALTTPSLELVGHADWTPARLPQPIVFATTGSGLAARRRPHRTPHPRASSDRLLATRRPRPASSIIRVRTARSGRSWSLKTHDHQNPGDGRARPCPAHPGRRLRLRMRRVRRRRRQPHPPERRRGCLCRDRLYEPEPQLVRNQPGAGRPTTTTSRSRRNSSPSAASTW